MFKKCWQRLRHQAFAVLFGIVLISACTVSAGAYGTKYSGNGMVLYSDLILSDFDPYMDSLVYSYCIIGELGGSMGAALFTKEPFVDDSGYLTVPAGGTIIIYNYSENSWVYGSSITAPSNSSFALLPLDSSMSIWTNFDLYKGSDILFQSSQPFSLTGFDYYVWSYTEGQVVTSLGLEFTSDVFSYDSLLRSYMLLRNLADEVLFVPYDPVLVDDYYYRSSNYWLKYVFTDNQFSIPVGLYLDSFSSVHFRYFIVPSSSDPIIDFSSTALTASNPQYDYQSAEFDVSWSNLPEIPYPDNVQYFIQGRLNDGAAAQPPEIYLGSSSDPPTSDVPVSFSFSGLQPETQYTATFELVYNTTGSFRDFTRSGVITTVSFTTLSDGSISEGDKAIINAIQQGNKDNQQWTDSQFGSAVGDLPDDTTETDNMISGLDQQEEAYKDDAYQRFQELSSSFSGFDGSVASGIGLAGTLFSRFFNALGSYKIIYTFPLLLGLALVIIGRLGRSHFRIEREPGDQFKIDGW